MDKLVTELKNLEVELGIIEKVLCDKKESEIFAKVEREGGTLPEYIYPNSEIPGTYMKVEPTGLTREQVNDLMLYRQTKYLSTIKSGVVFLGFIVGVPAFISLFILITS